MSIAQKMAIYEIKRDAIDHPETFRKLLQNSKSDLLDAYDKWFKKMLLVGKIKEPQLSKLLFYLQPIPNGKNR